MSGPSCEYEATRSIVNFYFSIRTSGFLGLSSALWKIELGFDFLQCLLSDEMRI